MARSIVRGISFAAIKYKKHPVHNSVLRNIAKLAAGCWSLLIRKKKIPIMESNYRVSGRKILDATDIYPITHVDSKQPSNPRQIGKRIPKQSRILEVGAFSTVQTSRESSWLTPPLHHLAPAPLVLVNEAENRKRANLIEDTLREYGLETTIEQIKPGPTVTLFGLVPGWIRKGRTIKGNIDLKDKEDDTKDRTTRVTVGSILAREKDLALALAVPSLRIQAPVPGESVMGIETPNPDPELVTLGSIMGSKSYQQAKNKARLPLALGKSSGGEVVAVDLAAMPHLLIAGATGSGKSVCLNTVICSLLMDTFPTDVRLVLIDPKRVELTPYNGIPHLAGPVRVETDEIVKTLRGMLKEMDRRYRVLEQAGARNIVTYNSKVAVENAMPYLVLAVDELADLMMVAPMDVEHSICRLAQLGRATGIHLIVATQRPSVDVVTGLIKANFPTRIAFQVASQVDSRTIMDITGAEKLLGRGDMLFISPELVMPKRIQGAYVSDAETEDIVQFWANQDHAAPILIDLEPPLSERQDTLSLGDTDDLFEKAAEMAATLSRISTSLLQRRLRIGYPRAARLREQLEDEGIIDAEGYYVG